MQSSASPADASTPAGPTAAVARLAGLAPAEAWPVADGLTGLEALHATMSGPAAGELVFAVDAARRAGTVARCLLSLAGRRPARDEA